MSEQNEKFPGGQRRKSLSTAEDRQSGNWRAWLKPMALLVFYPCQFISTPCFETQESPFRCADRPHLKSTAHGEMPGVAAGQMVRLALLDYQLCSDPQTLFARGAHHGENSPLGAKQQRHTRNAAVILARFLHQHPGTPS